MKKFLLLTMAILLSLSVQSQSSEKTVRLNLGTVAIDDHEDNQMIKRTADSAPQTMVKDIDGNNYNVIMIGTQTWIVENLKVTKLNDGEIIPLVTKDKEWLNSNNPALCWYSSSPFVGDSAGYVSTYGFLYNWYTVNTGKLCPKGWHVPTDEEWNILVEFVGGLDLAAAKLKEKGTLHWDSTRGSVTNEFGFTMLPAGIRGMDRKDNSIAPFARVGGLGAWWSATQIDASYAYCYGAYSGTIEGEDLRGYGNNLNRNKLTLKSTGISIRCIKDIK